MERLSKEEWLMNIAETVSLRGTCNRLQVGAIIVKNGMIVSTGYNGTAKGEKHCCELGCNSNNNCTFTIHAEINSILNCAKLGVSLNGCIMYVTAKPCSTCSRMIINAGITKVFYRNDYVGDGSIDLEKYIECTKM